MTSFPANHNNKKAIFYQTYRDKNLQTKTTKTTTTTHLQYVFQSDADGGSGEEQQLVDDFADVDAHVGGQVVDR